jgi:hypothetical protein
LLGVANDGARLQRLSEGFSPVKENNPVSTYAQKINAAWTKSVDSVIATAVLCAEADAKFEGEDKEALKRALTFKASTFSKLAKIGNDRRLHDEKTRSLLPPAYSIIYEVTFLSDERLQYAISSGKLHCEATRDEVVALRTARIPKATLPIDIFDEQEATSEPPTVAVKQPNIRFAEISVSGDYPDDRRLSLATDLRRVADTFGANLRLFLNAEERADKRNAAELNTFSKRLMQVGRRLARERINELRRQYKNRGEAWPFKPDDTEIRADADWEDIEFVFGDLAIEDEVEGLRAKAEELTKAPDLVVPEGYKEGGIENVQSLTPMPQISVRGWK